METNMNNAAAELLHINLDINEDAEGASDKEDNRNRQTEQQFLEQKAQWRPRIDDGEVSMNEYRCTICNFIETSNS